MNPALIPLHARVGPNLELHTTSPETSEWLQRKLTSAIWLNEDELDLHQSLQCPVGLLVSVDGTATRKTLTSDLLIYGVLSSAESCARPPTPPHSSPSDLNDHLSQPAGHPHELRIYAAPLSTSLLAQAQAFPSPPSAGEHASHAEFLPDINSPSPKRKRVATLFEVAAQHHRHIRHKGGEAVSQLMAHARPLSSSQNLQSLRMKRELEEEQPSPLHRSRSASIGAGLHRPGTTRAVRATLGDPQKRTPTPNPLEHSARRGSQQQQSSTFSLPAEEKCSAAPNSTPKDTESVVADNKDLITRTILTCMRVYGFHRTRSSTKSTSGVIELDPDSNLVPAAEVVRPETPASGPSTDDAEFKAMYHATYKAAAFALRKYLKPAIPGSSPPTLDKEKAMTYIDEFLRLFCEEH